jgi:hypothetical protein
MNLAIDLSPPEIRRLGWNTLKSQLGIAGGLRYLLEYSKGEGNYTKLRKEMFQDKKVKDIVADMKKEGFCHIINHD